MEKGFTITYEYGDNLYVNPTNRCNFNCSFCLRHNGPGGSIYAHDLWLTREPTEEEDPGLHREPGPLQVPAAGVRGLWRAELSLR